MKTHKRTLLTVSAVVARTRFGSIIRRAAEKNERIVVDRRGTPAVIIMGINDYVDTFAPTPGWLKEIGSEAKRKGLNKLSMKQIDAEISASRRERRAKIALARSVK